ncbi:putative Flagellar radial spoke protein 4 [Blattamonas nauphoetae]|uniref:Flagellar radial spoke protein 4 n=1 Tax=Blattamonas nauphoetae TaxID=2049346 RepID=A0ABQ9XQ92_9EUKA|nr:putative Flagellar radial spoke protein 4 [Blattamonas nauphoetae]
MTNAALEDALSFLQSSCGEEQSLFDHIASVIQKIMEDKPEDPLSLFEEISKEIKENKFLRKPSTVTALDETNAQTVLERLKNLSLNTTKRLFEDNNQRKKKSQVLIQDIRGDSPYFNRFGIGLGEEELLQISLHMSNYFCTQPVKSARFFGKITGIHHDYYIVETEPTPDMPADTTPNPYALEPDNTGEQTEAAPHDDPDEPSTPRAKPQKPFDLPPPEGREDRSPNQYVYFVCHDPADPWKRLPDVTPALIKASRLLVKDLTGNLDSTVATGSPSFPGLEKHYLRAQIARIAHSSSVIPRGFLKEEGMEEEEQEGGGVAVWDPAVDVATLNDPEQWVHQHLPLMVNGRVRKWPPPKEGEEEEEGGEEEGEGMAMLKKAEVWEGEDDAGNGSDGNMHRAIGEDRKLQEGRAPSFTLRKDTLPDSPVLVRSTFWPGSYTIAYGGQKAIVVRLYIGNGRKFTSLPHTLPPPPVLPEEYPELDEQIDPDVLKEDRVMARREESMVGNKEEEEEEEEGEEEEQE